MKLRIANPSEKTWHKQSYVLWFGACAATYVLVYADHLEDALEEAAAALVDWGLLGLIVTHDSQQAEDMYHEACEELGLNPDTVEGEEAYKAQEAATVDLTYTESGYIPSWEWGISLENPTKQELIALVKG